MLINLVVIRETIDLHLCSLRQLRNFEDTNPEEVEGERLFQSDMLLSTDQWRALRERKGLASTTYRWPEGSDGFPLVPYVFSNDGKLVH